MRITKNSKGKSVSAAFSVPPSACLTTLTGKGVRGLGSSLLWLAEPGIRTLTRRIEDDASTSLCQGEAITSAIAGSSS